MSRTYEITVQTYGEATISVRADSAEEALAVAKSKAGTGEILDDPPMYDWDTWSWTIVTDGEKQT
jgi:hypothetical protein